MAEKIGRLTGTLFLEGVSLTLRLGAIPFERIDPRKVSLDLTWAGDLLSSGLPSVEKLKEGILPGFLQNCSAFKSRCKLPGQIGFAHSNRSFYNKILRTFQTGMSPC